MKALKKLHHKDTTHHLFQPDGKRINVNEYGSSSRYQLETEPKYLQCECGYFGTAFSFYLDGCNHIVCPICREQEIRPI